MRDENKQQFANVLKCTGELFLPENYSQQRERTLLHVFQKLCEYFSELHPDKNHDLEMLRVEGGWLIKVKVGNPNDLEPGFSPPEPSAPW